MRRSRKQIEDAITGLIELQHRQVEINGMVIKVLQKLESKREEGREP